MTTTEAFELLGLKEGSSKEDIKKKYRELAKKHHPDVGGDEKEFKRVQEANAVLTGKQKADDDFTQNPFTSGFDFSSFFDFNPFKQNGPPRVERPPSDENHIFARFNISVSDIKQGRGLVLNYQKSIGCNDCSGVGGKSKEKCNVCHGNGKIRQERVVGNMHFVQTTDCRQCWSTGYTIVDVCKACHGNGFLTIEEKIHIDIKAKK